MLRQSVALYYARTWFHCNALCLLRVRPCALRSPEHRPDAVVMNFTQTNCCSNALHSTTQGPGFNAMHCAYFVTDRVSCAHLNTDRMLLRWDSHKQTATAMRCTVLRNDLVLFPHKPSSAAMPCAYLRTDRVLL